MLSDGKLATRRRYKIVDMRIPDDGGTAPAGHCPHCGYDQRGLLPGTRCPECGASFWPGVASGEINRWADDAVLALCCVCIVLVAGFVSCGISVWVFARSQAPAVMLAMVGSLCLFVGAVWYVLIALSALRRRAGFERLNLIRQRRARLRRWLLLDGLLLLVAVLAFVIARV